MLRNPRFYSFASFSIVSLIPFIRKRDSSRDLSFSITSSISSFEIINVVRCAAFEGRKANVPRWVSNPFFLCIPSSSFDVAAVNGNGIKTFLADILSRFFIKVKPVFSNDPRNLPRNPPDFTIKCSCLSVNNNLCGKLVSSSESTIIFDVIFKATSVPFLLVILIYIVVNYTILHLKCYLESFYINITLKQNKFTILSQVIVKNPKVSFTF